MKTRSVQNVQAHFRKLLDACAIDGGQTIAKRGQDVAVLVSVDEWHRLQASMRPSIKE